jgi:ADP-glucose pyrophosphorylase
MKFELGNKRLKLAEHCWIAPTANVIGDVTLANESSIWFNAVLRGDIENITVGEGSNVQDNCVLHTDNGIPLKVGSYVTIGHLVMLHGCTIGDNSLIGISATVLNSAVVGKNCIIGANSLIPERKVIPDNSLVMGSPGKVVRQVSEEEVKSIKENANRYIRNWKNYQQNLKKL